MSERTNSAPVTFMVRVVPDEAGGLVGVVERVRTGEKERFHDAAAIGPVIVRMLGARRDHIERSDSIP
ncbi:MAG TPA: hypothetical protein VFF62_01130 [Candidatus Nitrosocosmicus sp.]|jgi:hypothetical protein|nr:hypothetical protein [Candidatus Nitrosocosmicus sp.]